MKLSTFMAPLRALYSLLFLLVTRSLFGILILLISQNSSKAQSVSSDYTFSYHNGSVGLFNDGIDVFSGSSWDDNNPISVPIGFSFFYNGNTYTNCYVNANGHITFGSNSSRNEYYPISSNGNYAGAISAFGRDLRTSGHSSNSNVKYKTAETAPNRVFIVQWRNVRRYGVDGVIHFQIRLYEGSNMIEFRYGGNNFETSNNYPVQVGLRGASNGDFFNRTTTNNWAATTAGSSNMATNATSNTVSPVANSIYRWTLDTISGNIPLTVSGQWQVPCGVTEITVEAWGAGGSGGRATNAGSNGGGGGGAYAKKTMSVNVGDSYAYTIGAGGQSGTSNLNGGDTWFGSTSTLLAKGGSGVGDNNTSGGQGGQASASIGDVRYSGGNGGNAASHSGGGGGAARINNNGGNGAAPNGGSSVSPGGDGGRGARNDDGWFDLGFGPGYSGVNYGGGGGGGRAILGWINQYGGSGAQGYIKISYSYPNTGTPPPITTIEEISTDPTTGIGCENNEVTLQAFGGNIGAGVSTLWYDSEDSPNFAYINEFMGNSYSLSGANMGTVTNGNRTFTSTNGDPQINMQNVLTSPIDPSLHKYIVIRYRVVSGTAGSTQIYFKKNSMEYDEPRVVVAPLISDQEWHVLNIDMSTNTQWNNTGGNITGWRYDFASNNGVTMEIDYLALSSMTYLENTNADDSYFTTTVNTETSSFRAIRIADQAAVCGSVIPYTSPTQIDILRADKTFTGLINNDWDEAGNWNYNSVPNNTNCVFVNNGMHVNVNSPFAIAKSINVEANGAVIVNKNNSLTILESITNLGDGTNFIVKDSANLIQINDNAINTGSITVEKLFTFTDAPNPADDRKQYNFIISPVIGQNLKTIYPGNPTVIKHEEATNFYYNHSGAYIAGRGFSIKEPSKTAVPSTSVDSKFKGAPFNGDLSYPLSYTTTNPDVSHGFNLIGNPYPSNIDIEALYDANASIMEPNFYFWDNRGNTLYVQHGSNYSGDNFAKYNAASGTGTGIGLFAEGTDEEKRIPNQYAKVGTAFLIRALPTANGQPIQFKNLFRSINNSGPGYFGKGENFESESQNTKDRYWLSLATPTGIEYMNAIVYFEGGKNEFGLEDTETFGASNDIYSLVGNYELAIQGKSNFTTSDIVPIGIRVFQTGVHKISILQSEGVFANGQKIYLKDKYRNSLHDLSTGPYEFKSAAGQFNQRFEIVYKRLNISASSTKSLKNEVEIKKINGFIQVNSSIDKIADLEIFSLTGKSLYKNLKFDSKEIKIPMSLFNNEIVIVNVLTDKGEWYSKKFIIN